MTSLFASLDRKGLCFYPEIRSRRKPLQEADLWIHSDRFSVAHHVSKTEATDIGWQWTPALLAGRNELSARLNSEAFRSYFVFMVSRDPMPASSPEVASEVFRGRVENIRDGIAFVTLISGEGDTLVAQWPEKDLAKLAIGKGDLFELTMTDVNSQVTSNFRKLTRQLIPDDLWKEIEELRAAYTHLLDNQGDAGEVSG